MSWRAGLAAISSLSLPPGYVLSQMSEADVPPVAALLPTWYPDVKVGMESPHLDADFYRTQTQLVEVCDDARPLLPLVIRHDR